MCGHLIHFDNFVKTIAEGQREAKRGRERPTRTFVDQLEEKANVESHKIVSSSSQISIL